MSDTIRSRLKISREGIVLIKSFEGFRPRAVQTDSGGWVIGYGHTASAREGATVGEQDAELLLQYDLLPVAKALNDDVSVTLNQHQFDALASFAISVGVERFLSSDVLQSLNAGLAGEAANALIGWPESPRQDAALRRRAAERALFVADPAQPVHLADLLASPLPPPSDAVVLPTFAADARAAAVASLLGEEPPLFVAREPAEPAAVAAEAVPATSVETAPNPISASPHAAMRYSPYAAAMLGPLPGFPAVSSPVIAPTPATDAPVPVMEATTGDNPEPEAVPEPVNAQSDGGPTAGVSEIVEAVEAAPTTAPSPALAPFPASEDALVLTPPSEAGFSATRTAWDASQRDAQGAETGAARFEDEPTVSVLRHESEPVAPKRFDWGETGAFLIMGGVGLAACAASAAAFRLAVAAPSAMGETTVIAWALALIGAICVGVSSWNLYVRWGKAE